MTDGANLAGTRVVFVLPSFALNGAERQAYLLARHLQHQEGAAVVLVSLGGPGGIEKLCADAGLETEFFTLYHRGGNRLLQIADVLRFIWYLRRRRADVVLPYCMFQNVLCALTWRLGGARACLWNQRDEGRSRLEPWVERLAVGQLRTFISNSQHGADFLIDKLAVRPEQVRVVSNGVETPRVGSSRVEWRDKLGLGSADFVATMVATLHRFKDHATLIAAWRVVVDRLAAEGVRAHLLLAGLWEDRYEALTQQASTLRLEEHVHFLGEVEDVGGLLTACDLFVFSSFTEGVPNAVLEAMALGLAVVGTDYAGIREAVGDGCVHLLAPPRDVDRLASNIVAAAADQHMRAACGAKAREYLQQHYGVQRMCLTMAGIIRESLR